MRHPVQQDYSLYPTDRKHPKDTQPKPSWLKGWLTASGMRSEAVGSVTPFLRCLALAQVRLAWLEARASRSQYTMCQDTTREDGFPARPALEVLHGRLRLNGLQYLNYGLNSLLLNYESPAPSFLDLYLYLPPRQLGSLHNDFSPSTKLSPGSL
ncbi:hypothetical protein CPB85DRAFT_573191 [Mucidula mucida]|nr:hypothetical protein CPB85DRAFT_573191 [Mucidula mucida]